MTVEERIARLAAALRQFGLEDLAQQVEAGHYHQGSLLDFPLLTLLDQLTIAGSNQPETARSIAAPRLRVVMGEFGI